MEYEQRQSLIEGLEKDKAALLADLEARRARRLAGDEQPEWMVPHTDVPVVTERHQSHSDQPDPVEQQRVTHWVTREFDTAAVRAMIDDALVAFAEMLGAETAEIVKPLIKRLDCLEQRVNAQSDLNELKTVKADIADLRSKIERAGTRLRAVS